MSASPDIVAFSAEPSRQQIAPIWHTLVLIAFFDGIALLGWLGMYLLGRMHQPLPQEPHSVTAYSWTIILEWVAVFWVWLGVRKKGIRISDLIAGSWLDGTSFLKDVLIGAGLWAVWLGAWNVEYLLFGPMPSLYPAHFPTGILEVSLWMGVSVSAGFCEEVVFRGYLQKQIQVVTGSLPLAVVIQAFVFGIAHFDVSWARAGMHVFFGVLCGLLAVWRGSLRPGILGHVWTDISARLIRL